MSKDSPPESGRGKFVAFAFLSVDTDGLERAGHVNVNLFNNPTSLPNTPPSGQQKSVNKSPAVSYKQSTTSEIFHDKQGLSHVPTSSQSKLCRTETTRLTLTNAWIQENARRREKTILEIASRLLVNLYSSNRTFYDLVSNQ